MSTSSLKMKKHNTQNFVLIMHDYKRLMNNYKSLVWSIFGDDTLAADVNLDANVKIFGRLQ